MSLLFYFSKGNKRGISSLQISPDGQTLFIGNVDGSIQIWDLSTRTLKNILKSDVYENVNSLAVSLDGQTLFSGSSDGSIKLWDLTTNSLRITLPGNLSTITSIAISPIDRTLISSDLYGNIAVFDLSNNSIKTTFKVDPEWVSLNPHTIGYTDGVNRCNALFSADGQSIISGCDSESIKIWRIPR